MSTPAKKTDRSFARPPSDLYWPILGTNLTFAAAIYAFVWGVLGAIVSLLSAAFYLAVGVSRSLSLQELPRVPMILGLTIVGALAAAGVTVIVSLIVLPILAILVRSRHLSWLFSESALTNRPGRLAGGCVATITIAPLWLVVFLLPSQTRGMPVAFMLFLTLIAILISQIAGALASPADVVRLWHGWSPVIPHQFGLRQLFWAMTCIAIVLGLVASLPRPLVVLGGLLLFSAVAQLLTRGYSLKVARGLLKRRYERRRRNRLAARST